MPLFRAVQDGELQDILSTEMFSILSGQMEEKLFTTTLEGAASYAQQAGTSFNEVYTIVQTSIPGNVFETLWQGTVDGNVPSTIVPMNLLPVLTPPTALGYIPILPRLGSIP